VPEGSRVIRSNLSQSAAFPFQPYCDAGQLPELDGLLPPRVSINRGGVQGYGTPFSPYTTRPIAGRIWPKGDRNRGSSHLTLFGVAFQIYGKILALFGSVLILPYLEGVHRYVGFLGLVSTAALLWKSADRCLRMSRTICCDCGCEIVTACQYEGPMKTYAYI